MVKLSEEQKAQKKLKKDKVSAIIELVCKRFFKATQGIETLPAKFWNDIRFARHYKLQLIKCNALLKTYSAEAVLNALKSKGGLSCWSLSAPWIDPIIATEEAKIKVFKDKLEQFAQKQVDSKPVICDNTKRNEPRPAFSTKKSILDTLDDNPVKNISLPVDEKDPEWPFEPPY